MGKSSMGEFPLPRVPEILNTKKGLLWAQESWKHPELKCCERVEHEVRSKPA